MKVLATGTRAALVAMLVVAACEASPTSPSPSPIATVPIPSAPLALASPSPSPEGSTDGADPTVAPTSAGIVLGGTWVMPTAGTSLESYTTTLSARPTGHGPGDTTFNKVVFSGKWAGAPKTVLCKATRPADAGEWRCRADLLALGVPPGKVTFSFDVHGEGVPSARSPDGPRRVTYAVPPPKPADARWVSLGSVQANSWETVETYRARWSAPAGYADEFLVYNTWECPRESKQNAGTPCFVAGTPVDISMLELLRTVQGDARSAKVTRSYECGPPFGTILLRARNAYGVSSFAIAEAAEVPNPNDIIC